MNFRDDNVIIPDNVKQVVDFHNQIPKYLTFNYVKLDGKNKCGPCEVARIAGHRSCFTQVGEIYTVPTGTMPIKNTDYN